MSIITGSSMFFLSFFPLWISVLFLDIKSICSGSLHIQTEIISIMLIVVGVIASLIVLLVNLNPRNYNNAHSYTLQHVKEEKTITSEYLLSYILPLFAFDFTIWHEVVLFLIFFSVFAFLAIRHSHFSVNILLEIMNYRFYFCDLLNEDKVPIAKIVVTKEILSSHIGIEIKTRPINNEYFVQLSEEQ